VPVPSVTVTNWDTMSFDERRAAIVSHVDSVTIHPARPGYNRFDRSRIEVGWR
jgi:hypothetical protein